MKKYLPLGVALAVVLALVIVAFSSCGGKGTQAPQEQEQIPTMSQQGTESLNIYYRTSTGYLAPVARQLARSDNMAQSALDLLHDTSANWSDASMLGVMPTLPEGATASVNVSGGIAQVDLHGLVCTDQKSEALAVESMTATLLDLPQVELVHYTVDGKAAAMLPFGTSIAEAQTQAVVNAENEALSVSAGQSVALCRLAFVDSESGLLIPVTRALKDASLETTLAALTDPGEDSALQSAIPDNCSVVSANVSDDTAIIDMSEEFADLSAQEMKTAAKALIYTAMADTDALDVVIRAGGTALGEDRIGQVLPVALNEAVERLSALETIGTGTGDAIENDAVEDASVRPSQTPRRSPQPTTPLVSPSQSMRPSASPSVSPNRK